MAKLRHAGVMQDPPALPGRFHLAIAAIVIAAACAPAASPPTAKPPPAANSASTEIPDVPRRAPTDVTVTVLGPNLTQLPFYVGLQAGTFEEESVNLTILQLQSTVSIASMMENQVGYSTSGASVIRAAASGQPVRLIAGTKSEPDWQLISQPEISSVRELRGKRIGVLGPTGAATLVTFEMLAQFGVGKHEVDAINLHNAEGVFSGMLAKQVDGGLLSPPFTVRAPREGLRFLAHTAGAVEVLQGGLGTSVQRIRERPDEVEAVLRGLLRSTRLMQENKALVVELVSEQFEIEKDVAAEMYDEVVPRFTPDLSASEAVIQREIATQEEAIGQKLSVSVQDVADFGPLHRAQRALGMAHSSQRQ
jgi:NitT/TauT family transport system substrate-binding protein